MNKPFTEGFKYILGAFLLLLSIYFILNSNLTSGEQKLINSEYTTAPAVPGFSESIDLSHFQNYIDTIDSDKQILSFAILSTNVCPTCITNLIELDEIISSNEEVISRPILIFIDEEEKKVDRLVNVTDLNLDYLIVPSENTDPFFNSKSQYLVFIDRNTQKLIYEIVIPSSYNSINRKENTINEVLTLHQSILESKNQTNNQ